MLQYSHPDRKTNLGKQISDKYKKFFVFQVITGNQFRLDNLFFSNKHNNFFWKIIKKKLFEHRKIFWGESIKHYCIEISFF